MSSTPSFCPVQSASFDSLENIENELTSIWNQEVQSYVRTVENLVIHPSSPSVRLRRRAPRRKLSPKHAKIAGLVFTLVLATGASVYTLKSSQAAPTNTPIQKVMYQNAQTKVAAFRKEIEDGNHFLVEHSQPIQYQAKTGDTIDKISKKFHVSPNTIIKNNEPSKIEDVLEAGTKLTILPLDGIVHPVERNETLAELSKRYDVGIQDIIEANQLDNPHMIAEKQKVIIPNATDLKMRPKPVLEAIRQAKTDVQAAVSHSKTGRRLSWPSTGVVSSNYGWRWFRMHNGMDIAGPVGTPVKAVKEGRVVYSGWMGGYGYAIDIDHGGGVRTRYAHNSALKVSVGEHVGRGQVISSMGSTGHSTGSHLHFEVHVGGRAVDPRSYF